MLIELLSCPVIVYGSLCVAMAVVVYGLTLVAPIYTDHESCQPAEDDYTPEPCPHCPQPVHKGDSVVIDTGRGVVSHLECERVNRLAKRAGHN